MAIRNRQGIFDKFAPEKLVPGEFAFVRGGDPNSKDGMSIYASFEAGRTKRLATYEDMVENIRLATEDATDEIVQDVAAELIASTNRANEAAEDAEHNSERAERAAEEAENAIAGAKNPVLKSIGGFPDVGEVGRLYIDDTVSPRILYTWDEEDGYVLTGGDVDIDYSEIEFDTEEIVVENPMEDENKINGKLVTANFVNGYYTFEDSSINANSIVSVTRYVAINNYSSLIFGVHAQNGSVFIAAYSGNAAYNGSADIYITWINL